MLNTYPVFIKEKRLLKINELIISLDGDYYNHKELEIDLSLDSSDKLTIIYHLYTKYKLEFPKYLNGEFVIVIYNVNNGKAIVANDRFARRPIFYFNNSESLSFASEKKILIQSLKSNNKLNLDYVGLLQVFALRHNVGQRTFISNINSLKPASIVTIQGNKFDFRHYYRWEFKEDNFKYKNSLENLYQGLNNSLEKRLRNKKRILLWLSGGADSRSVAGAINRVGRTDVNTLTFGEKHSPELELVKRITNRLNFDWMSQKIVSSYINVAKIGAWRSEFGISALEHPFIDSHLLMKQNSDYLISSIPGLNELSGKFISLRMLLYGKKNINDNFFKKYSVNKELLDIFFRKEFFDKYYNELKESFSDVLNKIDFSDGFEKVFMFDILERQPQYSYLSDFVENDLFETLHPYCDNDVLETFLSVPYKYRLFSQFPLNMIYNFYPELRDIELSGGRGNLKKRNTPANYTYQLIKRKFFKSDKDLIWDMREALVQDYELLNADIFEVYNSSDELQYIFDREKFKYHIQYFQIHYLNFHFVWIY